MEPFCNSAVVFSVLIELFIVIEMGYKCCAPGCKTGYDRPKAGCSESAKLSIFRFPINEDLRKKWVKFLHRDNFQPNENHRLCELHFKASDIVSGTVDNDVTRRRSRGGMCLSRKRLSEYAVPSVLPNCPAYVYRIKM